MILCWLLALFSFGIIFTNHLDTDQLINIPDTQFEFGRRKLAQVSAQIRFESIAIGSHVEATIEQVQQLQHDQSHRGMVVANPQHFTIGECQRCRIAPGETTLGCNHRGKCAHRQVHILEVAMLDPEFDIFLQLPVAVLDAGKTVHKHWWAADKFKASGANGIFVNECLVGSGFQAVVLGQLKQY